MSAMVSVTVGASENTYAFDGRTGDINLLLWPVTFLAYVRYEVLKPFVAFGVEARLRDIWDGLRRTIADLGSGRPCRAIGCPNGVLTVG